MASYESIIGGEMSTELSSIFTIAAAKYIASQNIPDREALTTLMTAIALFIRNIDKDVAPGFKQGLIETI